MKKPSSHKKRRVPLASGVPVHCKFDKIVPASSLQLWEGNIKKHPPAKLDAAHLTVVGSDRKQGNGWRRPAVVSLLSGKITKGNGMVQMAQRHGLDVPIEYQAYKNRREEIRDLIADNKLQEHAIDDKDALKKLLGELEADDLAMTAVAQEEIEALLAKLEDPVTLKPLKIVPPPETAWFLIGVPVPRFKEIQPHVEALAAIPDIEYHSATSTIKAKAKT